MNVTFVRKLLLIPTIVLIALALLATINLWRFSSGDWLQQALPEPIAEQLSGKWNMRSLGTELSIEDAQFEYDQLSFTADFISLRFSFLSVLLGKPNLQWVGLDAPILEWDRASISPQQLRGLISLGFRELTLTDGLALIDDTEIHDIQLSMLKNGMLGEYAVQGSAEVFAGDLTSQLNVSTLLGIDGDDRIVVGKTQFDASLVMLNWTGRIAGKVRSLHLAPDNSAKLAYLSWSSNWKTSKEFMPYILDWAGGLTEGQFKDGRWQLETLDSAIAYRDSNDTAHTLAIQSNESQWFNGQIQGQMGLSLLAEYPLESPYQSYNLVMSGQLREPDGFGRWHQNSLRLVTIERDGTQLAHQISASDTQIQPSSGQWLLNDGQWVLQENGQQLTDYGFAQISGDWPELNIEQNNTMSDRLQPALKLIAPDVERLDALFSLLVP